MRQVRRDALRSWSACRLFRGLDEDEAAGLAEALGVRGERVEPGSQLCAWGDAVGEAAFVETGAVSLFSYDARGHRILLGVRAAPFLLGGLAIFTDDVRAPFCMRAKTPCAVLRFSRARARRLLDETRSGATGAFGMRFFVNLGELLAASLTNALARGDILSQRTVRDRISLFLSDAADRARSPRFSIEMDRQQLADYLSIDRTTLSEELSKMKGEGLLSYRRNSFELHGWPQPPTGAGPAAPCRA